MKELSDIIATATAAVAKPYFLLPIHAGDAIFRERVYCYELYHQMRLLWPNDCPYSLNGEIDKGGHPVMSELVGGVKPDFLVHTPGDMAGNQAIIEVKAQSADNAGIRKDLTTLSSFKAKAGYERAIYLIYGPAAETMVQKIETAQADLEDLESIEVWLHLGPMSPAIHIN